MQCSSSFTLTPSLQLFLRALILSVVAIRVVLSPFASSPQSHPFLQENVQSLKKWIFREKSCGPASLASEAKTPSWGAPPSLSAHLQLQAPRPLTHPPGLHRLETPHPRAETRYLYSALVSSALPQRSQPSPEPSARPSGPQERPKLSSRTANTAPRAHPGSFRGTANSQSARRAVARGPLGLQVRAPTGLPQAMPEEPSRRTAPPGLSPLFTSLCSGPLFSLTHHLERNGGNRNVEEERRTSGREAVAEETGREAGLVWSAGRSLQAGLPGRWVPEHPLLVSVNPGETERAGM